MADAEPGVVDVAVDVVGEKDRGDGEGGEEEADRAPDEAPSQSRRQGEDREVGEEADPDEGEGDPGVDRCYPSGFLLPPALEESDGGSGGAGYGSCPAPGA